MGNDAKPSKSYCYIQAYKFEAGKWQYKSKEDEPGTITIQGPEGPKDIHRLEYNEAKEALGYHHCPDGKMKEELQCITSKVNQWTTNVCASGLRRYLVWQGLNTTIWRSIDYKLRVTTFSYKQGEEIAAALYRPLIPRLGAARTFPLLFRYAPRCYLGLGLLHPYTEQRHTHGPCHPHPRHGKHIHWQALTCILRTGIH